MRAATLVLGLLLSGSALAGPRIAISSRSWNFGRVWLGDRCETEVLIRNTGDAPLRILGVHTSCGCTVAHTTKDVLAPGENDTLKLSYDTSRPKPNVEQKITIDTDDPTNLTILIDVKGSVLQVYSGVPDEVIPFGFLPEDAADPHAITLKNNMEQPVKLTPRPPADKNFEIKLEPLEEGRQYKLTVTPKPPLTRGIHTWMVELETGLEKMPTMRVPVMATVLGPVSVVPEKIDVMFGAGLPTSHTIQLRYLPEKRMKITGLTANSTHVRAKQQQIVPANANVRYETIPIKVDLPAFNGIEPGLQLVIETDSADEQYRKIVVPIVRAATPSVTLGSTSQPTKPGDPASQPTNDLP